MECTEKLRKQFTVDCGLPINIFSSPEFQYFIDLYDEMFDSKRKWNNFLKTISQFNTEDEFFKHRDSLIKKALATIFKSDGYQRFLLEDFSIEGPKNSKHNIYRKCHFGKQLISIDFTEANFQALYTYDKTIFNAKTYSNFMKRFTKDSYFLESKPMRALIFGRLNHTQISAYERVLRNNIIKLIPEYEDKIVFLSDDEIVFEGNEQDYKKVLEIIKRINLNLKVELFVVEALVNNKKLVAETHFYIKRFILRNYSGRCDFSIKVTEKNYFAQFYKIIKGLQIKPYDLLIVEQGEIKTSPIVLKGKVKGSYDN